MALTPEQYCDTHSPIIAKTIATLTRHYSPLTPLTIDDVTSIVNMEIWQLAIRPEKRDTISNLGAWLATTCSRQLAKELDKARSPVHLSRYALDKLHTTRTPRPYTSVTLDNTPESSTIDETSIDFIMFDLQRNKSAQEKQFIEWWIQDTLASGKKPSMSETRARLKELNITNHDMFLATLMDTLADYRNTTNA